MTEYKFGIMQGRLTPAAELQAFPVGAWEKEFALAAEIGFDTIEWLLDEATGDNNPLYSAEGRNLICDLSTHYQLPIATLCADYIQQSPFSTPDKGLFKQRIVKFQRVIDCAADIGVRCILIPCLETPLIPGSMDEDRLATALVQLCPAAQEHGIRLGLEMSRPAGKQLALVKRLAHPAPGIYYDLGNATAENYDIAADIRMLGPMLVGVHIKDRLKGGDSVLLGEGDTRFGDAFAALKETGFSGPHVFETPRGDEPVATARRQLEYVRTILRGITI